MIVKISFLKKRVIKHKKPTKTITAKIMITKRIVIEDFSILDFFSFGVKYCVWNYQRIKSSRNKRDF